MTSWDGYLALGGTELLNEERFRTYIESVMPGSPLRKRSLASVSSLHRALGDPAYSTPVEDGAPWVDYDDVATHGFIGMRRMDMQGLDDSTFAAPTTESIGRGGAVGYGRDGSREMRFVMLLAGTNPESVQAGLSWLSKSLRSREVVRALAPTVADASTLRYFLQRPDDIEEILNRVQNPLADRLVESLVGVGGSGYALRTPSGNGDQWTYRITSRVAALVEAQLRIDERPRATPGQTWVARARIRRDATMLGNRTLALLLRFRDQHGALIPAVGATDTSVPNGVLYRWVGARYDSRSQRLDPDGMLTNWMVNPSARGKVVGLGTFAGGKSTAVLAGTGSARRYRATTNASVADQSVSSPLVRAASGQQWWARARGQIVSAFGSRHFRAEVAFYDAARKLIKRTAGTQVDRVVSGTRTTWAGTKGRSTSTWMNGDTRRRNLCTNPNFAVDTASMSGRNAAIGREKTNILGTTYVLRVRPSDGSSIVTGLTLGTDQIKKGNVVWITFRAAGAGGTIGSTLRGEGWEPYGGGDPLVPISITPTPTTFAIRIKALQDAPVIRIARVSNDNVRLWRIAKIGYITGADSTFFDGDTAPGGVQFDPTLFTVSAGDVAPDDTAYASLVLTSVSAGAGEATDVTAYDQVALIQQDAPAGDDPVPVLPAYFDGDGVSTYIPYDAFTITSTPGAGAADTASYDAVVTADAPPNATSAELAVQRLAAGGAATDIFYADNLMLADYDPDDAVPDFTPITNRDLNASNERWLHDVRLTSGPQIISEQTYGPNGCNGATMQVEFTLVAELPDRLADANDRVPLPLPSLQQTTGSGLDAFAKITDASILKNYFQQFSQDSPVVPTSWVSKATAGSIEPTGIRAGGSDVNPYILQVRSGPAGTTFDTTISAIRALGNDGGYDAAVASIWLGADGAGKTFTVKLQTYNGSSSVSAITKTFTTPDASSDILDSAHRLDFTLADINGAADGFRFIITGPTGTGRYYIGNPQVTLTSTAQPLLHGALPDDGTWTYSFDGFGYSVREPVIDVASHTLFPNLTAPPGTTASLAGYDDVGLTTWRTFAEIPAEVVPRNATAVPIVRVDFERFISRWVRFRFYRNPLGLSPEQIPTAGYEYEWVVDQFKANVKSPGAAGFMSLVIDGVAERVWLRAWDGTVIPGDQYVGTSDGGPIDWPQLTGDQWVVVVDYPVFRQSNAVPTTETWWRPSMALMIKE